MLTQLDLQTIAETRLQEAQILLDSGFYNGAAYLLGYVTETALKACICGTLGVDFPTDKGGIRGALMTHTIPDLAYLAGLERALKIRKDESTNFAVNWQLVATWKTESRYTAISDTAEITARNFLRALTDADDGVITWLQQQPQWLRLPTS